MKTFKLSRVFLVTAIMVMSSFSNGDAKYDSEKNSVIITSEIQAGAGIGFITIHSDQKITLQASALSDDKRLISLCGIDPSLGIIFLDKNLKLGYSPPSVSGTTDYDPAVKGGFVAYFEFVGDDALDLLDLFMEYNFVGFAIDGSNCVEDNEMSNGILPINFSARGIERAMNRIK